MPIRTLTARFVDSTQHLMHLRVSRAEDPPGSRPTSVVQIGADREATIRQVKSERQTNEYKNEKIDRMTTQQRNQRQRAAIRPLPDVFWKQWEGQMMSRYPRGIDQASAVKSTAFTNRPVIVYDNAYLESVVAGRKPDRRMVLLKSGPEAFAHHRMEKAVKLAVRDWQHEQQLLVNGEAAGGAAGGGEDLKYAAYAKFANLSVIEAFSKHKGGEDNTRGETKKRRKKAVKDVSVTFLA